MRVLIVVVLAAVAALTGFSQSTARAAPPVAVSIELMPTAFFPVEIGSWQVSGAIDDSGSFVRTEAHGTGSLPDGFVPEHTGAFQEVFVLSGVRGTLTVRDQSLLTTTGVTVVWEIASGTGAYEAVSGHGKGEFDGAAFTLFLTGVASKAG